MEGGIEHLAPQGVSSPLGPYAHAVRVPAGADWLHVAGQVSVGEDGQVVGAGDIRAQTDRVFRNLEGVLTAAGFSFTDVVKTTTFLVRSEDVEVFREIRLPFYRRYFPSGEYPAGTLVVVQRLAGEAFLLEVEAIAAKVP